MKKRKQFFFEKKNQKTFYWLAPSSGERFAPTLKSLLLLFFRKEVLAFLLLSIAPAHAQTPQGQFGSPSRFTEPTGEAIYAGVCAGCHMAQGQGATGAAAYPALTRNPRLAGNAYPILRVLRGHGAMPGFASTLTNQQIADVVAYVRQNFGNARLSAPTPDEVQSLR